MVYYYRNPKTKEPITSEFEDSADAYQAMVRLPYDERAFCHLVNTEWRTALAAYEIQVDFSIIGKEPIKDHFTLFTDTGDVSTMYVCYIENEQKGERELYSSAIKVGRYLTQFYGLTGAELDEAVRKLTRKYLEIEVKFARTREEIRDLYLRCGNESNGVGSCMTHATSDYDGRDEINRVSYHPTEAYAGFDLAVAYIERSGCVAARAVCWPDEKKYGRVYGDFGRFSAAMDTLGYVNADLTGARMAKILLRNPDSRYRMKYLVPYIDGAGCVTEYDDHFRIGITDDARVQHPHGGSTEGFILISTVVDINGERISAGLAVRALHPGTGEDSYIRYDEVETKTEVVNGQRFIKSDNPAYYGETHKGQRLPLTYLSYNYVSFEGKWYDSSEMRRVTKPGARHYEFVPFEVFFRDYAICEITGTGYPRNSMRWMEHRAWWSNDAFAAHGIEIDGKNYARVLVQEQVAA